MFTITDITVSEIAISDDYEYLIKGTDILDRGYFQEGGILYWIDNYGDEKTWLWAAPNISEEEIKAWKEENDISVQDFFDTAGYHLSGWGVCPRSFFKDEGKEVIEIGFFEML